MAKNWTIRETRKSDAQALFALMLVGWLDTYINEEAGVSQEFVLETSIGRLRYDFFEKECRFYYLENSIDNMHFVAEDINGVIVGFIHSRREDGKQVLEGLYTYKEFHGSGLAQDLVGKFLDWENKSLDSEVGTVEYNRRAIRFYEKVGFRDNGVRYNLFDVIPCIDMVKKNVKEER